MFILFYLCYKKWRQQSEVKKLKSKAAYHRDVSGSSLAVILVVLQIPATYLKMDSESVRKMKTHRDIGLRFIYYRIDGESVCWCLKMTCKRLPIIF
jgi:hypothetical protein